MIDQHQQAQTQTTIAGNVTGPVLSGNFQEQVTVIMQQMAASGISALHSIPAPPRDFTGRTEDVQVILTAFDRGETITGVRGLAAWQGE